MKALLSIGSVARVTGGPARSSQGLCAGLERCGCEAWLLSHTPGEQAWLPGVNHFLASAQPGYRGSLEALERAISMVQPDIIHCNGLWSPYSHATVICAKRHKIPLIIAPRGTLAPWALNYKKWKKRLALWLYQKRDLLAADAFHVTSEEEATQVRAQGLKQPIILLPNGVDLPDLSQVRTQRSEGVKSVLYLGRIHFQKGLRELVQAWAEVKKRSTVGREGTDAHLCVEEPRNSFWQLELVGPDVAGHQAQLIAEARVLGLHVVVGDRLLRTQRSADGSGNENVPDIWFSGSLDDQEKWGAYAESDVVVLPSYTENFGLTIAEGLAAAKPVITTKGTPWSELENCANTRMRECANQKTKFSHSVSTNELINERTHELTSTGRAGWWIDIGKDPLVEALREAIELSDDERRVMGENGRRLMDVKYGWRAISSNMLRAFEWLQNRESKPPFVSP